MRFLSTSVLFVSLALPTLAQDPPQNASFVGSFNQASSSYGDIWADGDFVYLARYGQAEIDIVDVSNPSSPSLAANYVVPSPDNGSSAQDVKVANGLLFISLESSDPNGVQIVDVRDPFNPSFLTNVDLEPGFFEQIHNTYYEDGWLYICNSADNEIAILDLRNYDPDNAPASITSWDYRLQGVGNIFVHDVTVQNGKLFAAAWDRLVVYDVSSIGSSAPSYLGEARGVSCHAVWATDDAEYVITTEEREGGAIRLYQMVDNGSSVTLQPRDSWVIDTGKAFSSHNPLVVGDRVYVSSYQAGLTVLEIDRTTGTFEEVASYDTSTEGAFGYAGSWGVNPFLGEDRVALSDIQNGMVIVDLSAVQISFATARPEMVAAGVAATISVDVTGTGTALVDPSEVTLHSRVNGGSFQPTLMTFMGGDNYQAQLPPMGCDSTIEYYVSADDTLGNKYTDPIDAPGRLHAVWSGEATAVVFSDDFQSSLGWSVTNSGVSAGAWERGNPVGTGAQPERGDPDAAGARCYFTGQGSNPDSNGEADLDGGPTVLTSPLLDFSAGDGLIRYSRWFFNDDGDGDELVVEITDDAGTNWSTVETVANKAGGWVKSVIRVSDHVQPTGQVQVRFSSSDEPNSSVTEVGVDEFSAEVFVCTSAASVLSRSGQGINPVVYTTADVPSLGTTWTATIDSSAQPGATVNYLVGFLGAFDPGIVLGLGELMMDVTTDNVLADAIVPIGGISTHDIPIANDGALQGLFVSTQGLIFEPGSSALTNAIDITLDY